MFKPPKIKIVGDTVYCTNPYSGITFRVSLEDLNIVKTMNWNVNTGSLYLTKYMAKRTVYLHKYIMKPNLGQVVDFKDGDKLNCTRSNLRVCTLMESRKNRRFTTKNATGFKGVYIRHDSKYFARITSNNKIIHLGYYDNVIDAAKAYNDAALKYHKEFACLNVIPKDRGKGVAGPAKRPPGG